MVVFENVKKKKLLELGFEEEKVKTIHEDLRLKDGEAALVLYNSGKLLLQGKKSYVEKTAEKLRKAGVGRLAEKESFRKETGWVIGSDETLKGDTFGGLVVAAVKSDLGMRKKLEELGVADSKSLADKEIVQIAEKIKRLVPCEIRSLLPEEYNKDGSITEMLNRLHQESARYLAPGKHIVDKYPGCSVGDVQEEKAESKYVEVAAASILARAAALKQLDYLSIEAGFRIPKGSTHVKWALKELKDKNLSFKKFVKLNFSNVREFL